MTSPILHAYQISLVLSLVPTEEQQISHWSWPILILHAHQIGGLGPVWILGLKFSHLKSLDLGHPIRWTNGWINFLVHTQLITSSLVGKVELKWTNSYQIHVS